MSSGVANFVIVALLLVCFWIYTLWKGSRKLNNDIKNVAQQHSLIRHDNSVRQLCRAIHLINPHVSPGVDYIIRHDSPDQQAVIAEWLADAPRPTNDQINTALSEVSNSYHEEEFATMRRAEYPSVGDQLEAAYEARHGNPAMQQKLDEQIHLVREKYPKTDTCV